MLDLIAALSIAAVCPDPEVINKSKLTWNKHDQRVLESNIGFCKRKLPRSPCVRKFVKVNSRAYFILCGGKRGTSNKNKGQSDKSNLRAPAPSR